MALGKLIGQSSIFFSSGLKHLWVGRPFRAPRLMSLHPGLKRPTSQSLRRGWFFGVTYHNTRGAKALATAAWAILLDRCAVMGKCPNSRGRHRRLPSSDVPGARNRCVRCNCPYGNYNDLFRSGRCSQDKFPRSDSTESLTPHRLQRHHALRPVRGL
jgi:hypothetical protein